MKHIREMKHMKSAIYYHDGSTYYDDYNDMAEDELYSVRDYKFKIGDYVRLNDSIIVYRILAVSPDSRSEYKIGRADGGFGTNRAEEHMLTPISEFERDTMKYNL